MDLLSRRPASVTAALVLVLLDALFWMGFGIIVALGLHPALPDGAVVRWMYTFLAAGCSLALAALVVFLTRRGSARYNKIAYVLLAALLGLIALFTVLDQFGLSDLVVLLFTLAPLVLLIASRRWYFQPQP
jgi:di/tricarboxylate transporter